MLFSVFCKYAKGVRMAVFQNFANILYPKRYLYKENLEVASKSSCA